MQGLLVFEVQDLGDMMRSGAFDMMYHEHRDYHSVKPLEKVLKRWGLDIVDYRTPPTHGGSKRYYCRRPFSSRSFEEKIRRAKDMLLSQLDGITGPIACFGATAKACTLIHHFGLAGRIAYCVDDTLQKQGRYLPGTNIQIYPTSHLLEVP